MSYISRNIEDQIKKSLSQRKVVLLTGARQVGKTTLLKQVFKCFDYVTMEDPRTLLLAQNDSVLFFDEHEKPLIIDEVQKHPDFFPIIKWKVDENQEMGQMILTGSQTYHLMKSVSESLAGRIRILEMPALSLREIVGIKKNQAFVPKYINESKNTNKNCDLWSIIQRGCMPELANKNIDWDAYYSDYEQAYLERDVRDLINIKNESKFFNFMIVCAARTAQLLNVSDISDCVRIDNKTTNEWLSVLQASNIIRLIKPFWTNVGKTVAKTPKLHFLDTGLACHLTRWTSADTLKNGAYAGQIFESFVVSEILKSFMNAGENLRDIWFYRDNKKREIDLVIQRDRVIHPIEIKVKAQVSASDVSNFSVLEQIDGFNVGYGNVVCLTKKPYIVMDKVQAISPFDI